MTFRGDNIHRVTAEGRVGPPDPRLLLEGHYHAAMILNFIRSMFDGGFADLRTADRWNLRDFRDAQVTEKYKDVLQKIEGTLDFLDALEFSTPQRQVSSHFFTSHEGLILPYEEALTRRVPRREGWYDLSAHMLWVGNRTRQLKGAHLAFFRGVENPIGVKIGSDCSPEDLEQLCLILNPKKQEGKVVVITRLGAKKVGDLLPPLVARASEKKLGFRPIWMVDPMHGNTIRTASGVKTRLFDDIVGETERSAQILGDCGQRLGGVHFEMSGEPVTECLGGASGVEEADLSRDYRSLCDPRLNYSQSLEMAFRIVDIGQKGLPTPG